MRMVKVLPLPGVLSSVSVGNEAAEILEALVTNASPLAGREVQALGLPRGALLLAVLREESGQPLAFIPTGQTRIQAGDHVILLSLRTVIGKVESVLAAS